MTDNRHKLKRTNSNIPQICWNLLYNCVVLGLFGVVPNYYMLFIVIGFLKTLSSNSFTIAELLFIVHFHKSILKNLLSY